MKISIQKIILKLLNVKILTFILVIKNLAMRYLYFFILFTFISFFAFGQTKNKVIIDSIIRKIDKNKRTSNDSIAQWGLQLLSISKKYNNDTIEYEAVRRLSYFYLRKGKFDSVKKYNSLMLESAKKIDSFKIVSSYQNIAAYYNYVSKKDSAMYVLKKAQKLGNNNLLSKNRKDSLQKIKLILFIETAIVKNHFRDKSFEKALQLTYLNLKTSNKYGIKTFHAWNYFYLGLINLELGNYDEAEKYYKKEYDYSVKQKRKDMEGFALMHLGNVFFAKRDIKSAKNYYLKANTIFNKNDYLKGKLISKKKIFSIYENENKLAEAIKIGEEYVVDYLKNSVQDDYLSGFYIKLGRVFHKVGNSLKGEYYINKGFRHVTNNPNENNVNLINQAYLTYKELNQHSKALKYYETVTKLKDSLLINEKFTNQLAEANTKFETEQKEKELAQQKIATQEQELLTQKANTRNWLLLLSLVAVAIVSFAIYKRYKSETKAKQIISIQKDTIENLQKELHHRVKNNLAIIDTFIEIAKEEFNDEKFDKKLTEIQNRIVSINEIHKQLYQSSDVTNLNIKNYIDVLSKNVVQSFENKDISIHKNIENINLNADTSFPVGLIINEFLTNSYKYAFEKNKGEVTIKMTDQGKNYILALSDNGKGLPDNFDIEQTETFGLRIIKLLTKQIDGVFNLESKNGVQLTIQIPKI